MSMRQFILNIFFNNASQGLQFGSRWLFNITLINILEIKSYAIFSFVYSISNILLSILPFGSSIFLINEVKDVDESKNKLFDSILIAGVLFFFFLIIYLVLSPFLNYIKGWDLAIYGLFLGFVLSLNLILFSFFKGIGNFIKELKAYSVFFVFLILFIGYLFFFKNSIKSLHFLFLILISINSIVFILTLFTNTILLKTVFNKNLFCKKRLYKAFFERKYFGFQEIATAVYTQAGMLILFYLLNTETYGYYRALFVIVSPLFLITVALSQVVLNFLKSKKIKQLIVYFRRIQFFSFGAGAILILIIYFLKDVIFQIIKVNATNEIEIAFKLVLVTALLRFVFSNYEMLIIIFNKQKYRFYIVLNIAIINIVLLFSLLPEYGIIGAVLTNLISYFLLLLGLLIISERTIFLKK